MKEINHHKKDKKYFKKNKPKNISDLAADTAERRFTETSKRIKEEEQQKAEAPKEKQKQRALMLKTAFIPKWFSKFQVFTFIIITVGAVTFFFIKYPDAGTSLSILFILTSLAIGALSVFIFTISLKAWFIQRDGRWLNRFSYNWNREAYTEILSTSYFNVILILRISFDSSVFPDKQKQIANAVDELIQDTVMKDTQVRWSGDDSIEVLSPEIKAYKYHHPGGYEPYNRHLHLWFQMFVDRVLPIIHREFPVKYLNFSNENKEMKQIFSKRKDY